ncbi:MAG: hypothetical protein HY737_05900 [Candidatus Omnitrophica bacterium]|nr:hypothetical protein [Candidatus Omnitrophota bacterium]
MGRNVAGRWMALAIVVGMARASAAMAADAQQMEKNVRAQLDGTVWTVDMQSPSESKGRSQKDTLTFTKWGVVSERLTKAGYANSNYSLTFPNAQTPVWDTTLSDEKLGIVRLHGEFRGGSLQGVISEAPAKGKPMDYEFSGTETSGKVIDPSQTPTPPAPPAAPPVPVNPEAVTPPPATPPPPSAVVVPPAPPSAPAATSPHAAQEKKKKRGWF